MLVHPWDAPVDADEWRTFVRSQGFGHLVAPGRDRHVPVVVPTQFLLEGDDVLLHLARPNPLWAAVAERPVVVLSVAGDWAYVPSSWKALDGEDPSMGVPTTYYAAAQLVGQAEVLDDPEVVADLLRAQLAAYEPDGGAADPLAHGSLVRAVRGLRIHVEEVRAKFKYGGNVDDAHRLAVAARLDERDGPGDAAARAHLLRRSGLTGPGGPRQP